MEIDKLTDLECVDDDFEEGAHEKLDMQLRPFSFIPSQNLDSVLPFILATIAEQSGSCLLEKISQYRGMRSHNKERAQAPKYVIRWLEEWFQVCAAFE